MIILYGFTIALAFTLLLWVSKRSLARAAAGIMIFGFVFLGLCMAAPYVAKFLMEIDLAASLFRQLTEEEIKQIVLSIVLAIVFLIVVLVKPENHS